jgi:hypothetical protein
MPNRYRGYLPEKDQPDYDIMGRRDGAFELYGWIETGVTFHGLFLDLESAKACAEELEGSK